MNSWLLYREVHNKSAAEYPLLKYIRIITTQLLACSQYKRTSAGGYNSIHQELRYDGLAHWPASKQSQRKCLVCKKNTTYGCTKCQVPVHIDCFIMYHTK